MVLLSPPPLSLSLPSSPFLFNHLSSRSQLKAALKEKIYELPERTWRQLCCSSRPSSQINICRRDLVLAGLASTVSIVLPLAEAAGDEELEMGDMVDGINAYSYMYPLKLPSKKFLFKWVESRKPERYSSAAPLSPDARLRIVSERVDFVDNLIISVTVGPPNSTFIKTNDKSKWTAKDVADSVLSDKAALRVTSTQRMAESSVLDAHAVQIDGEPYWCYEYLIRKSPTKNIIEESSVYRHYIASTAERDGYLYTLNASTLSTKWDQMGDLLKETAASFRLLPPTEDYVPPYKDPWRFW